LTTRRVALAGSRRTRLTDEPIGAPDPAGRVTVSLHLKDPSEPPRVPGSAEDFAALAQPTTRAELARRRAQQFAPAELLARAFAQEHGLEVVQVDLGKRMVRLRGSAGGIAAAFGTALMRYRAGRRHYHANTEPLHAPEPLAPWLRGVLGLDTRPRRPRRRRLSPFVPAAGAPAAQALWPADIARLYGVRAPGAGAGQCIAIIAPSGGYLPDDCALAAQHIGAPFPDIAEVSIDNGRNRFGRAPLADQELALDLQTAAAVAPAASLAIYFTDDSEQGLADAVLAAVHDDIRRPHVVSISWGTSEAEWSSLPHALDVANAALGDAVTLGVIVIAAAGDRLATNGADDDLVHVNFPASSPYVLSCGGTAITLAPDGASIASEVVWKNGDVGTGGGISDLFVVPDYQHGLAVPVSVSTGKAGRGLPDVAATAAFTNGYRIVVNRQEIVQGGTSAVAPLWAGLVALANAERGAPLKRIHPALYGDPTLFRAITRGNNKSGPLGYDATAGWNACAGLGVPIGAAILAKLTAVA
jgi:kumamolisin